MTQWTDAKPTDICDCHFEYGDEPNQEFYRGHVYRNRGVLKFHGVFGDKVLHANLADLDGCWLRLDIPAEKEREKTLGEVLAALMRKYPLVEHIDTIAAEFITEYKRRNPQVVRYTTTPPFSLEQAAEEEADELEKVKDALREQVETLTAERDALKQANASLTEERNDAILDADHIELYKKCYEDTSASFDSLKQSFDRVVKQRDDWEKAYHALLAAQSMPASEPTKQSCAGAEPTKASSVIGARTPEAEQGVRFPRQELDPPAVIDVRVYDADRYGEPRLILRFGKVHRVFIAGGKMATGDPIAAEYTNIRERRFAEPVTEAVLYDMAEAAAKSYTKAYCNAVERAAWRIAMRAALAAAGIEVEG